MKKAAGYFLACVWNVLFFYLCGYWQQMHLNVEWFIDLFFGGLAVLLLAWGEVRVVWQIYYRKKFRAYTRRTFDNKFIRQCILLVLYHVVVSCLLLALVVVQSLFYMSLLAVALSTGWLVGSKTLWTSEEASYYMTEGGKLYHVEAVTENTKVFEIACTRAGERDRTITIEKKTEIKNV